MKTAGELWGVSTKINKEKKKQKEKLTATTIQFIPKEPR